MRRTKDESLTDEIKSDEGHAMQCEGVTQLEKSEVEKEDTGG